MKQNKILGWIARNNTQSMLLRLSKQTVHINFKHFKIKRCYLLCIAPVSIGLQTEPFATQIPFVDSGTTLLFNIFPPTTDCDLKSPRVLFTALTIANSPKRKKMNAIHFRPVGQKRTLSGPPSILPLPNAESGIVSRVYDTRAARA